MGAEDSDPSNSDAARQAQIDKQFAKLILDGLEVSDPDKEALMAMKDGNANLPAPHLAKPERLAVTPPRSAEAKESLTDFSSLSEAVKLEWLVKYRLQMFKDSYTRACEAEASHDEKQIRYSEVTSAESWVELLDDLVENPDGPKFIP